MSPILIAAVALCLSASPAPEAARAEYRSKKALMARTADAQVELALWCESKGLMAERDTHLARAILRDPSHSIARGLLGQVQHQGRWQRPEAVADSLRTDPEWIAKRQVYETKRQKAPVEVDAQWKLAKWCLQEGLDREARAHLNAVVKLDPEHEPARKKLGQKRFDGRWMSPEQASIERNEAQEQREADRRWESEILKWIKQLKDRKAGKCNEARLALDRIDDPRSVPSVWRLLIVSEHGDVALGASILGRIDTTASSRALASLAAFASDPEVRRQSAETLRSRDPREYADLLIGLIRDPIRFEVRGQGTADSPRRLFVEGQDRNFERIYLPPPMLKPGDVLGFDNAGQPLVRRLMSSMRSRPGFWTTEYYDIRGATRSSDSGWLSAGELTTILQQRSTGTGTGQRQAPIEEQLPLTKPLNEASPSFRRSPRDWSISTTGTYSLRQLMAEYSRTLESLNARLDHEVDALKSANISISASNQSIASILEDATKVSIGTDREAWKKWWIGQVGYAFMTPISPPKETVSETVSVDFTPQSPPLSVTSNSFTYIQISCFAAGTLVNTISGMRAIESLLPGDLVLTLDQKSGSLRYQPILITHHNPPSTTVRITTQDETIASSDFHRFWKPGAGWVMARDLKVGDRLRTATGIRTVQALSTGPKEPVFNLDVAADANFFVGEASLLVHDNTLPNHRDEPYDRLAARP